MSFIFAISGKSSNKNSVSSSSPSNFKCLCLWMAATAASRLNSHFCGFFTRLIFFAAGSESAPSGSFRYGFKNSKCSAMPLCRIAKPFCRHLVYAYRRLLQWFSQSWAVAPLPIISATLFQTS
uniref:(northern house mosquito) hypothetical protein n=1 Tax=Culex pipiens TaxID=7175 RepID=A0A8D8CUK3_CULPI